MIKEGIFMSFLDDGESIIHKHFPDLGVDGAVARAFVSRININFMNKLATIGFMGDSIAAPLTCSYISFPGK